MVYNSTNQQMQGESAPGIQQKHKIKKFLSLLKKAQNTEFIKLVIQNLNAEIGGKAITAEPVMRPDKLLKILHFQVTGIVRCQDSKVRENQFTRLKSAEALTNFIIGKLVAPQRMVQRVQKKEAVSEDLNLSGICRVLMNGLNSEDDKTRQKWARKIELYQNFIIDFESLADPNSQQSALFKAIEVQDLFGQNEERIESLVTQYDWLLRDSIVTEKTEESKVGKKRGARQEIEEIEDKKAVNEFLQSLSGKSLLQGAKRRKGGEGEKWKMMVLSPCLALMLNCSLMLTDPRWEARQAAAVSLGGLLKFLSEKVRQVTDRTDPDWMFADLTAFATLSGSTPLVVSSVSHLSFISILTNILSRLSVLLIKDQFVDQQDIQMLTPVRSEAVALLNRLSHLITLLNHPTLNSNISLLMTSLPYLNQVSYQDWQLRLSYFLILKGISISNTSTPYSPIQIALFNQFGTQSLIQAIVSVEDNVKIVITEIIDVYLDLYFQLEQKGGDRYVYIDQILINLTQALREADDLEGGVIFMFDLINDILVHPLFSVSHSSFRIQSDVFFPFNFHRSIKARRKFNKLINKFLRIPAFFTRDQLFTLHTLTVQAIIMEIDSELLEILKENLKLLVLSLVCESTDQPLLIEPPGRLNRILEGNLNGYVDYLSSHLLMPTRFQRWLYSFELKTEDFHQFLILESSCFESLNQNYYVLIPEPVSRREKNTFYLKKLESCVEILAIISCFANLQVYLSQFLKLNSVPSIVSMNDIIEYLVYERIAKMSPNEQFLLSLNHEYAFRLSQISQTQTNIKDFIDMPKLTQQVDKITSNLNRSNKKQLTPIFLTIKAHFDQAIFQVGNSMTLVEQMYKTGIPPTWIDFPALDKIMNNDLPVFLEQQGSGFSKAFKSMVDQMVEMYEDLKGNQQSICERFRALVICQHLACYNYFQRSLSSPNPGQEAVKLHDKLNDLIHPIWNLIRSEYLSFYQEYFARVMAIDLLPALKQADKTKSLEQVQKLILKGLAKLSILQTSKFDGINHFISDLKSIEVLRQKLKSQTEGIIKKSKTGTEIEGMQRESEEAVSFNQYSLDNIEVRGCELIIQQWIKLTNGDILSLYSHPSILNDFLTMLTQSKDQTLSFENVQGYLSVTFKIVQNLLLFFGLRQNQKLEVHSLQSITETLWLITTQIMVKSEIFQIKNLRFAEDLLVNQFYLYAALRDVIGKDQEELTAQREILREKQLGLILGMVELVDKRSRYGFLALENLLEQCLTSKQRLELIEEEDEDLVPRGHKEVQQIICRESSEILKFLQLFLVPVIRSLQFSREIFEGDEKRAMQILSMMIQLLPLCHNLEEEDQKLLREKVGTMLNTSEEFLSTFTQTNIQLKDFQLSVHPNTEFRDYQRQGIKWMIQLGRFGLNSALCDDMGLGKTIQSLVVVLNESKLLRESTGQRPVSLIVCPNTLTYQWYKEVDKFFPHLEVSKLILDSSYASQQILQKVREGEIDLVVASYERVRNEIGVLASIPFFYVVLDEGHRIKNPKSKTTQSVKMLRSERKLILSGTPLQNKVSELWSLFDFLMPNFLEDERTFNSRYNKFLTSNLKKLSENLEETQNFVQALKSLKKRIAPFIMRRTKAEVLKDLPPRMIQDFECQMKEVQGRIYDFVEQNYPIEQVTSNQTEVGEFDEEKAKNGSQILQNLIIHRKVCNHPSFIRDLLPASLRNQLADESVEESGKLMGLIDLLEECGIIESTAIECESENGEQKQKRVKEYDEAIDKQAGATEFEGLLQIPLDEMDEGSDQEQQAKETEKPVDQRALGNHKALIFCQMQTYLQMVINKVLIPYDVSYIYLESSLSGQQRFEAVEQFNNDPSVKVMIMTTSVGGLGLNLTGADTVIFMEHDWNPMKDAQAIDRAHRIGQVRSVNVYRLITRETVEEKIMGLQRFKRNLARNLIQSQGISEEQAGSMEIHDLLGCFEEHTAFKNTD